MDQIGYFCSAHIVKIHGLHFDCFFKINDNIRVKKCNCHRKKFIHDYLDFLNRYFNFCFIKYHAGFKRNLWFENGYFKNFPILIYSKKESFRAKSTFKSLYKILMNIIKTGRKPTFQFLLKCDFHRPFIDWNELNGRQFS